MPRESGLTKQLLAASCGSGICATTVLPPRRWPSPLPSEWFDLFICACVELTGDADRERLESTNRDTDVAEGRQEPKSGFARGHHAGNLEHGRRIGNRVLGSGRGLPLE